MTYPLRIFVSWVCHCAVSCVPSSLLYVSIHPVLCMLFLQLGHWWVLATARFTLTMSVLCWAHSHTVSLIV